MKTDVAIQNEVLRALAVDGRVRRADVGVAVDDGIVVLTGALPDDEACAAAEEIAHAIKGVRDVASELVVKEPGAPERTDADVARSVRRCLTATGLPCAEHVRVTVRGGVVVLEGTLERVHDCDAMCRAAQHADGVRDVRNRLVVDPAPLTPDEIHTAIESALACHAAHVARHVRVAVADGGVVVSGTVTSEAEREAVIGALRAAPGVLTLDDRLEVTP